MRRLVADFVLRFFLRCLQISYLGYRETKKECNSDVVICFLGKDLGGLVAGAAVCLSIHAKLKSYARRTGIAPKWL